MSYREENAKMGLALAIVAGAGYALFWGLRWAWHLLTAYFHA